MKFSFKLKMKIQFVLFLGETVYVLTLNVQGVLF